MDFESNYNESPEDLNDESVFGGEWASRHNQEIWKAAKADGGQMRSPLQPATGGLVFCVKKDSDKKLWTEYAKKSGRSGDLITFGEEADGGPREETHAHNANR